MSDKLFDHFVHFMAHRELEKLLKMTPEEQNAYLGLTKSAQHSPSMTLHPKNNDV